MITRFDKYKLNESFELSGKHSFMTFLQIVSNHDFHFILNNHYTKLYNYHFFFSSETIKDVDEFVDIFKYKHSLPAAYDILLKIKSNKLAFFFGVKDDLNLRYGFIDIDNSISYVVGEFILSKEYFASVSKYKAMCFVNKFLQGADIKNLPTLSKIKKDFDGFYKSKKSRKLEVLDNRVINYFSKDQFKEDELNMNRPYRVLDQWISKKSWKDLVEYSVDDESEDDLKFIIILK
jgi:hypothetical protein